ncbi:MAG TPA: sigma-70 family RNA polymerase sigma factor [Candidatus Limnocylindrales bacterium]|nr:sigma-70 family RNA polymerase sigma factor [Candidatus Limnocylindrales bacterium]
MEAIRAEAIQASGDADLVARAAGGDEVAFTRLVALHHDAMARVAFLVTGDLDMADEAVAAAWALAWRRLGQVREPGRVRAWLVSVAANEARALARARRRHPVVEIEAAAGVVDRGSPDPFGQSADMDLVNALNRLDPDDRRLLALRYVAGFDSFELGRATGRSASGTRARLARLLDRLRRELTDG